MIWSLISWMFIGLIVGLIARVVVPGRQSMGMWGTIGLGIAGALAGGFVSWLITGVPYGTTYTAAYAWPGWILSIIGSTVLLLALRRRRNLH